MSNPSPSPSNPHAPPSQPTPPAEPLTQADANAARSEESIIQFFNWQHLPEHLQKVSQPFQELAVRIVASLPRNAERSVALRKLLECKDAAVRALIAK